jgi:hypothetical protein
MKPLRMMVVTWLALALLGWIACWTVGHQLAVAIAQHANETLLRIGDGKFSDPVLFLERRLQEGIWLFTWAGALSLLVAAGAKALSRKLNRLWQWIPFAGLGFIGLNLWLAIAVRTCLFWLLFWNGAGHTPNLVQFQIKLLLMSENTAPLKVVTTGSSQVHAQIDPRIINQHFSGKIWCTDLHFPGNRASDYLWLDRKLNGRQVDYIVCYLSEMSLFHSGFSEGFPLFFGWRDLPVFGRLGGQVRWGSQAVIYALLGDVLPVFWLRDAIAQRVFGESLVGLKQREQVESLASNMEQRAQEMARSHHLGSEAVFQKTAFDEFLTRCERQHRRVVICCGQLNPILGKELAPEMRPDFLAFARSMAAAHKNAILLNESELPAQSASDYDDLTHVNLDTRRRFTEFLADIMSLWGRP